MKIICIVILACALAVGYTGFVLLAAGFAGFNDRIRKLKNGDRKGKN